MGIVDIKPTFLDKFSSLLDSEKQDPVEVGTPVQQLSDSPESNPAIINPEESAPELPHEVIPQPTPINSSPNVIPPNPPSSEPIELPPGEDYRKGETPLPLGLELSNVNDPEVIETHLVKFLSAENLAQRKSIIANSNLETSELAQTALASPLPKPTNITYLTTSRDESEKRTDFLFIISWDENQKAPKKPVVVELHRWSDNDPPQIHSQAFLQVSEEELLRFASAANEKIESFHVLARCIPKCFESIPGASQKATLTLPSFPKDSNPLKAYFPKNSELLTQLKNEMGGRAMSDIVPLTVTLAWSDPSITPRYLELVKINAFDWHP